MQVRLLNQKYTLREIWKLKAGLLGACLAPKKIFNFMRVQGSYRFRLSNVKGTPYAVMIEPTSACNLACEMCARTVYDLSGQGQSFPLDQYARLMDEIGDRMIILSLWNYGEPLLNPNLPEMIRMARAKKIFVMVTTNGTLLKGSTAEDMIASGLNYLKISVDSTSEATYRRIRKGGSLSEVCRNIESFMQLKRDKKVNHPFVDLTYLVMKVNEKEIKEARQLAARLSVDRISYRKLDPHFVENPEEVLPANLIYRLPTHVESRKSRRKVPPCSRVWTQAVINSDSRLYPCCLDLKLQHSLGSLDDGIPFESVWNGKHYRAFRRAQRENPDCFQICENCHARNFSEEVYFDG